MKFYFLKLLNNLLKISRSLMKLVGNPNFGLGRRPYSLHFVSSLHSCRSVFLWHPQVSFCWNLLPTWGVIKPQRPWHARRNCGSFRARCMELPPHPCWVGWHDSHRIMQKTASSAEAPWRNDGSWSSGTDTLSGFFSFYISFCSVETVQRRIFITFDQPQFKNCFK